MRRWPVAAALGAALVGCILLPLVAHDAVPDARHRFVVAHDGTDFMVSATGDLTVRQVLDVQVLGNREFVFYDSIDRDDPADARVRRDVTDLQVTRDGQRVPYVANATSSGRYWTVRIGNRGAHHLPMGIHRYVVTYRMDHVLDPDAGSSTRFDWLLIPATFNEPVEAADLTVHLPGAARSATCSASDGGTCDVSGQGSSELAVHASHVPRLGSVRLDAGVDLPAPPGPARLPWSTRVLPILGPSVLGVLVVLVLALLAGLGGLVLARGAFERRIPPSADTTPPEDVGPAAAAYLAQEHLDHRAFVATLFWAAQKRMVRLGQDGGRWSITGTMAEDPGADSDVAVALTAFLGGPEGTFVGHRRDDTSYADLHARLLDMEDAVRDWCVRAGYVRRTGPTRGLSFVLVGVATFVGFFAALTRTADRSIAGLVPAAFALGAMPLLGEGAATTRTRRGRDVAARLAGLRGTFTSPVRAGVGASSHTDLYVAFLPWAVMLGCLDPWTRRFREGTGIRPPLPDYLEPVAASTDEDVEAVILDFARALEARRQRDGAE